MSKGVITVDDILTKDECQIFKDLIDNNKTIEKVERSDYALYDRMIYKNKEFAEKIFFWIFFNKIL